MKLNRPFGGTNETLSIIGCNGKTRNNINNK